MAAGSVPRLRGLVRKAPLPKTPQCGGAGSPHRSRKQSLAGPRRAPRPTAGVHGPTPRLGAPPRKTPPRPCHVSVPLLTSF